MVNCLYVSLENRTSHQTCQSQSLSQNQSLSTRKDRVGNETVATIVCPVCEAFAYPLDDVQGDATPEVSRQTLESVFYDQLTTLGHVSLYEGAGTGRGRTGGGAMIVVFLSVLMVSLYQFKGTANTPTFPALHEITRRERVSHQDPFNVFCDAGQLEHGCPPLVCC